MDVTQEKVCSGRVKTERQQVVPLGVEEGTIKVDFELGGRKVGFSRQGRWDGPCRSRDTTAKNTIYLEPLKPSVWNHHKAGVGSRER